MRSLRLRYVADQAWGAVIGLFALVAAITFFTQPEALAHSAVGIALHPYDEVWNGMYGIAGILLVLGIIWMAPRVELVGLAFLISAVTTNLVATVYVRGLTPALLPATTYLAVVLGSLIRAWRMFDATRER